MNGNKLLKEVLASLLAIKASIRDTAEPCVNRRLDEVISQLQQLIENDESQAVSHARALALLGSVFDKIPSIAALIKLLSD